MTGATGLTVYAATLLFSLVALGLYILGAARYLTNLEENTCEMTYMFEDPQYVRIALNERDRERYPRFALYVYGEGYATEKYRRMKFSGIPVLFVPGNAGSHEQVRSLASVSLRKSIKDRAPFHFDYFTVSLGKDYSAFYGGVLEDETRFVSLCFKKILGLYDESATSVVLIGHSMGGVVAKAALLRSLESRAFSNDTDANKKSLASILVTLASPHNPIFLPDRTIARFYEELGTRGKKIGRMSETGTTFVSIGGGRRDVLVGPSQTNDPTADRNLASSGVPGLWTSTDHLCILWCKQLVLAIVRGLFDCVDATARPPRIPSDPEANVRALSYHLTSRIYGKKRRASVPPYREKYKFEAGGEWIERLERRYTWSSGTTANPATNKTVYLMIRFDEAIALASYDTVSIDAVNLESRDWLFACSARAIVAHSRVCEWGWNVTNRTRLLPEPRKHRHRTSVDVQRRDLRGLKISHIVVRIPIEELREKRRSGGGGGGSFVNIHVDLYNRAERTILLEDATPITGATRLYDLFPRGGRRARGGLWSPNPLGGVTSPRGSLRYYAGLADIRDAVIVEIEVLAEAVARIDSDEHPQAILEFTESAGSGRDSLGETQVRAVERKDGRFGKKRVVFYLSGEEGDAGLRIDLKPEHSYRVEIRRAGIVDRVACLVRDRWPTVYPITVSLCLLAIASRLDARPRALKTTLGIYLLVAVIFDFLFEALVALGLLHVAAVTACFLVVFFGTVARGVTSRFLARIVSVPSAWFDWIIGGFDRLPVLTSLVLLSLASATCGAIGPLLSVPLSFLKLTKLYEDYLEELFMASVRHLIPRYARGKGKRRGAIESSPRDGTDEKPEATVIPTVLPSTSRTTSRTTSKGFLLNNLLLFVTWMLSAIPAIPSALVWATNFRYETRLSTEDTTMLLVWVVLALSSSLGLVEISVIETPSDSNKRRIFSAYVLRLLAYSMAFTTVIEKSAYYQWIVSPLVAIAVTCLALLSLFPGVPPGPSARPSARPIA